LLLIKGRSTERFRVAILLLLALWPLDAQLQAQKGRDRVTVELRVYPRYDDSAESVREFASLLTAIPARVVNVMPGDTLSGIVTREFAFGPSQLPLTYSLTEYWILKRNHLTKAGDLKPGTLAVPALPPRAKGDPSRFNSLVPFLNVLGVAELEPSRGLVVAAPSVPDDRRAATQQILRFSVTESELADLSRSAAWGTETSRTADAVMRIHLARRPDADSATPSVLEPDELRTLQGRLSKVSRPTYLFVLDTGWPRADYQESREQLLALSMQIRSNARLSAPRYKIGPYAPPPNMHCELVAKSIQELRDLDKAGVIRVIFLPLLPVQGSIDVMRDILEISETSYRLLLGFGGSDAEGIKMLEKQVTDSVTNLIVKLQADEQRTGASDDIDVRPGWIGAVRAFAGLVASYGHTVFLVNESWTVYPGTYSVGSSDDPVGLQVCAAGNDPAADISATRIDFAYRSLSYPDTVAVLNLTRRDGSLACGSSTVDPAKLGTAAVVGFDGSLDDTCGTSFAAPRVAWLLALDASSGDPVSPADWPGQIRRRITAAARSSIAQTWFDIAAFFRDAPKAAQ
jgi:hypothetical protein